jgi:predicted phosphoribosyltransferase
MDKNFVSRATVGRLFATQLADLRGEPVAVLALSKGGAIIAIEMAKELHAMSGVLLLKHVYLPDKKTALGIINNKGGFTYEAGLNESLIEDYKSEYRGSIEIEKINAVHELHLLSQNSTLEPQHFNDKTVIVVTDFAKTGTAFQAALDFLKPARTKDVIVASAVAQMKAVDVMHKLGNRVLIARTTDKDFPPEHFFVENDLPESPELDKMMTQVLLQW